LNLPGKEGHYTFWGTCKGTTKAGAPCQRTVVYGNGFCQAHGGDSTEFMRERFEKIKAKATLDGAAAQQKLSRSERQLFRN
jgi:hypothetical protein